MPTATCRPTDLVRPVLDLTDEELAALVGPATGVVQAPHLLGLDPAQRDAAVLTAYRSLVSRGWVVAPDSTPPAAPRADGLVEVPVRIVAELAHVLELRARARSVVCLHRTTEGGGRSRYLHVAGTPGGAPSVVLDEVVEPTGLHRFGLVHPEDVAAVALEEVLAEDAAGSDGTEVALDAAAAAAGAADPGLVAELGRATVVAELVVRRPGRDAGLLLGVLSGPTSVHLVRSRAGSGAPVLVRPVARATAEAAVREELARA